MTKQRTGAWSGRLPGPGHTIAGKGHGGIVHAGSSSRVPSSPPGAAGRRARRSPAASGRGLPLALACLLLTLAPAVAAEVPPGLPLGARKPPAEEAASAEGGVRKTLQERLESARERVREARLRRQIFDDPGYAPPAGITRREGDIVLTYGDRLVMFRESAVRSLEAQQHLLGEMEAFKATAAAWRGFDVPPPYSILMSDELSEQLAVQRAKFESVGQRVAASERLIEEFRAARLEADKAARSAAEASEADSGNPATEWRWKSAGLNVESIDAFIAWSVAELERVRLERALVAARIGMLERQLQVVRENCAYGRQDLAEALSTLDRQAQELEAGFSASAAENNRLGSQLVMARQALDEARRALGRGAPGAAEVLATAEARLRVVIAQSDSARASGELFTVGIAFLREMREAWSVRYTLLNDPSVLEREVAAKRLKVMLARAGALVANGAADVASFRAEEDACIERLASLREGTPAAEREQEVLHAIRAKLRVAERQQRTMESSGQAVRRWLEEARVDVREEVVAERVRHRSAELLLFFRRFWQLELFSVEDTMEIGGETVAVARPVTVRKVVIIALWIALGLSLSNIVTRVAHRALIERYQIGPEQAKVMRRWISALNLLVLLLIGLYLVRIPLTAFAFLGGALAIGFGFGTQTLIKNLVSGVLMLMERQIRAGDIVELDGVVGTVEAVDVRSTRIRNFDGKETVIPNSVFLDSKVTNWTLSTREVRLCIEVAVAAGTPAAAISELLVKCADSHREVLKAPAPFVHLLAFDGNALVCQLYCWVRLVGDVVAARVSSDLRFMVEKAVAEAGIELPWRDRVRYLEAGKPIRVIVSPPGDA